MSMNTQARVRNRNLIIENIVVDSLEIGIAAQKGEIRSKRARLAGVSPPARPRIPIDQGKLLT